MDTTTEHTPTVGPIDGPIPKVIFGLGVGKHVAWVDFHYDTAVAYMRSLGLSDEHIAATTFLVNPSPVQELLTMRDATYQGGMISAVGPLHDVNHELIHELSHEADEIRGIRDSQTYRRIGYYAGKAAFAGAAVGVLEGLIALCNRDVDAMVVGIGGVVIWGISLGAQYAIAQFSPEEARAREREVAYGVPVLVTYEPKPQQTTPHRTLGSTIRTLFDEEA